MIKGILIDLDNTLYSYDECHEIGLKSSFEHLNRTHSSITNDQFQSLYKNIQKELKNRLPQRAASHHRLLYFQSILEKLDIWTPSLCLDLYQAYWSSFLNKMKLFDGAIEFLKTLTLKNIPVVIVTDLTAQIQFEKLEKLAISQYIKFVVTSEEIGIEKPDQKVFQAALNKIVCNPSEVIMIGDSFEKDILGSKLSGIKAIWFDKSKNWSCNEELPQVQKCSSFKELYELIK